MRRGEGAAAWKLGGAWQCAVSTFGGESKSCNALNPARTATKAGEKEVACTAVGRTKGACMDGMVLQHSWLCPWWCDEQGMVLQHCIAASGVDMAKQSNAYVAKAIAITANKIGLAKRICNQARGVLDLSQGRMAQSRHTSMIEVSVRPLKNRNSVGRSSRHGVNSAALLVENVHSQEWLCYKAITRLMDGAIVLRRPLPVACRQLCKRSRIDCLHTEEGTRHGDCRTNSPRFRVHQRAFY